MNSVSKKAMIKDTLRSANGEFLFMQKTKMEVINDKVTRSICVFHDPNFVFVPSQGLSEGIL